MFTGFLQIWLVLGAELSSDPNQLQGGVTPLQLSREVSATCVDLRPRKEGGAWSPKRNHWLGKGGGSLVVMTVLMVLCFGYCASREREKSLAWANLRVTGQRQEGLGGNHDAQREFVSGRAMKLRTNSTVHFALLNSLLSSRPKAGVMPQLRKMLFLETNSAPRVQ